MGILLAFAPFIVFALVSRFVGPVQGLIAGTATSAALVGRDWLTPGRSAKILEIGTLALFAGLSLYALLGGAAGSIFGAKLSVDVGLLVIVLFSMAIRRPFTLQYARESVPSTLWDDPRFIRVNYVITAVWALAFLILIAADLVLVYDPALPQRVGIIATVLALVGAYKFTTWYPSRQPSSPVAQ
jgi:hypothetical protein